jgi:predicted DNA-binding transcriptional regulator
MTTDLPMLYGCDVLPPMKTKDERNDTPKTTKGVRSRKAANRFAVLNAFADYSLAGLKRSEMAVWLLLYRDTKPDGLARTSQVDLARRAGIDERTARRAVESLRRAGLLTVVHRGGLRRGTSAYRVQPVIGEP